MSQDIFTRDNLLRVENPNILVGESPVKYRVEEIYLDGKLKKRRMLMKKRRAMEFLWHSLVLSNYAEVMNVSHKKLDVIRDEKEKAIFYFTEEKGFDKSLIESIVPKVEAFSLNEDKLKVSTHIINEKMRIIREVRLMSFSKVFIYTFGFKNCKKDKKDLQGNKQSAQ